MLYPSMAQLIKKVGNRYLLVNLAARRARQIAEEAEEKEIRLNDKPVTLAIEDIMAERIVYDPDAPRFEEAPEKEEAPETAEETVIDIDMDEDDEEENGEEQED